jgi:hypothetical protein
MTSVTRPASILAAAILIAIVSGCGGGGASEDRPPANTGESTTAAAVPSSPPPIDTSSLSKAELVKHYNATCARIRGDRTRGVSHYVHEVKLKEGETRDDIMVKAIKLIAMSSFGAQSEELRKIGAPRGDEEEVEEILAAYERATEIGAKMKDIAEKARVERSFAQAARMAKAYGFDKCVVGGVDNPF